jgi:hypothetical protein
MKTHHITTANLGFPRIGPRELKFALEKFWAGARIFSRPATQAGKPDRRFSESLSFVVFLRMFAARLIHPFQVVHEGDIGSHVLAAGIDALVSGLAGA